MMRRSGMRTRDQLASYSSSEKTTPVFAVRMPSAYDPHMAVLRLRGPLRRLAGDRSEHALEAATVLELLVAVEREYPAITGWILDERRRVRRHINVFVNGERGSEGTAVGPSDRDVTLFAAPLGRRIRESARFRRRQHTLTGAVMIDFSLGVRQN